MKIVTLAKDFLPTIFLFLVLSSSILEITLPRFFGVKLNYYFATICLLEAIRNLKNIKPNLLLIYFFLIQSALFLLSLSSTSSLGNLKDFVISNIFLTLGILIIDNTKKFKLFLFCTLIGFIGVTLSPGLLHILDYKRKFYGGARQVSDTLIGSADHYIAYSMRALISFSLSLLFFVNTKNKLLKSLFGFFTIISFIGAFTSGSRAAILCLGANIGIISLIILKPLCNGKFIIPRKLLFAGYGLVLIVFPYKKIINLFLKDVKNMGSMGNRQILYENAFSLFSESKIFGIGLGNYRNIIGQPVHSDFLKSLTEIGILGLSLELLSWLTIAILIFESKAYSKLNKSLKNEQASIIFVALLASLLIWGVVENTGLLRGTRLYYAVFTIALVHYNLISTRKQSSPCEVTP